MPPFDSLDDVTPSSMKALRTLGQRFYTNPGAVGDDEHTADQGMPFDGDHYSMQTTLSPEEQDRNREEYADRRLARQAGIEHLQALIRGSQQEHNPEFDDTRTRERKALGEDLSDEFQPRDLARGDVEAERAAGRQLAPNATAARARSQQDKLQQLETQFVAPADARRDASIQAAQATADAKVQETNAKYSKASRAVDILRDVIKNGKTVDKDTGLPRSMTGDEILQRAGQMGVELPAPEGMVTMRAPDGSIKEVAPQDVQHYLDLKAVVVR